MRPLLRRRLLVAAAVLVAAPDVGDRVASAAPQAAPAPAATATRTISVDEIQPGMVGYGLTVFRGTRPERFPVKVIGILRNFLPQEDVILIESDDPRLEHAGIVAGMSGSPIYFQDRLAGALAYGWHFAKDPVAGVTPIANMLDEVARPTRGRARTPMAANDSRPTTSPMGTTDSAASGFGPSLVQASVPLSVAGLTPAVVDELAGWLAPYHMTPLAAGGAGPLSPSTNGAPAPGPDRFEPGSAISVELIRGDISAVATGTVTWVEGDKLLAFGHPMFNLGEVYLPVASAEIHTILAAVSSSFKIASPLRELGSLVQDRQTGLVGDMGQRVDMIPLRVHVGGPDRAPHDLRCEVARHRFLTPTLVATVVANALQAAAADVADATITVRTRVDLHGFPPLTLVDHVYSNDGVSARVLGGMVGIKAVNDLLFNPFAPVTFDRIDVDVAVDYRPDVTEITGVSLATDALEPGSRPSLRVALRPYAGPEVVESIPIEVPRGMAGQTIKIEAAAGALVKPDLAPPESLAGLLENLRQSYPASAIVVSLQSPDDAMTLRGSVVTGLPGSVWDTLRPAASSRHGDTFKESARFVSDGHGVLAGRQEIQVRVKDLPTK